MSVYCLQSHRGVLLHSHRSLFIWIVATSPLMRIRPSILNSTFIEGDFITRHDKIKIERSNVCLKILERKLHLSTLEDHQVTKALLIISEVISRSSLTLN